MKKLSIIVLSYKHEDFIARALEGIFMQKVNFPIELILCDDHSPDNTDAVIQNCLKSTPQHIEVKYTRHKKNMGSTPNFYYALKQVTGDYLAFCEGDDYWTHENKLQLQYNFLEQNPEYALCFHQAINVSPYPEIDGTLFSTVEDRDYSPLEIYQHWIVHTATVMMKSETINTEAFKKTLSDPTLQYFDTVLFLASATLGKIRGFHQTLSAYRRHDAGLSFGATNFRRDLKHNHLDTIIANYHGGAIQQHAEWQIFMRSYQNFFSSLKKGKLITALQFLKWIFKYYKKWGIYMLKKIK